MNHRKTTSFARLTAGIILLSATVSRGEDAVPACTSARIQERFADMGEQESRRIALMEKFYREARQGLKSSNVLPLFLSQTSSRDDSRMDIKAIAKKVGNLESYECQALEQYHEEFMEDLKNLRQDLAELVIRPKSDKLRAAVDSYKKIVDQHKHRMALAVSVLKASYGVSHFAVTMGIRDNLGWTYDERTVATATSYGKSVDEARDLAVQKLEPQLLNMNRDRIRTDFIDGAYVTHLESIAVLK